MRKRVIFEKDGGVNNRNAEYESPVIQVEEILVEHGFAESDPDPENPPVIVW